MYLALGAGPALIWHMALCVQTDPAYKNVIKLSLVIKLSSRNEPTRNVWNLMGTTGEKSLTRKINRFFSQLTFWRPSSLGIGPL